MRVGILLILLQSVLLCAETRAEGPVLQAESADKVVRALLVSGDPQPHEEPDAALLSTPSFSLAINLDARLAQYLIPLCAATAAVYPIRGPPARQ